MPDNAQGDTFGLDWRDPESSRPGLSIVSPGRNQSLNQVLSICCIRSPVLQAQGAQKPNERWRTRQKADISVGVEQ